VSTTLVLATPARAWADEPGPDTAPTPMLTRWYAADAPSRLAQIDAEILARASTPLRAEGGSTLRFAPAALSPFAPTPKPIKLSEGAIVAIVVGGVIVTVLVVVGLVVLSRPKKNDPDPYRPPKP
jgi:hypothetical protein